MARSYLERKEAWAAKMKERDFRVPPSEERLPPGQHWVEKLPVLDLGIHPKVTTEEWRLEISGLVERPVALDWAALEALPQRELVADFHCVTTWSVKDCSWKGVRVSDLLDQVRPLEEANQVLFTAYDGYTTNLEIDLLMAGDGLLATELNGQPLPVPHGGPARILLPRLYAWKGAKWIRRIEFLADRSGGYWEKRGYSETADPWTNDRFTQPARQW